MAQFREREEDENDGIPVDLKQKVCPQCRRKLQPWERTCPEDGAAPVEAVTMGSVEDGILARLAPGLLADLDEEATELDAAPELDQAPELDAAPGPDEAPEGHQADGSPTDLHDRDPAARDDPEVAPEPLFGHASDTPDVEPLFGRAPDGSPGWPRP